ncbi:unnamed protein product [Calypogeia fissa]
MAPTKMMVFVMLAVLASPILQVQATKNFTTGDDELIGVALNLEYLEAEFFLFGVFGEGLDKFAPWLTGGGPAPIGAQKANLDAQTADVFAQLGFQEVGHLEAIKPKIGVQAFPRVQLDLSKKNWAMMFDAVVGYTLSPPFDVYGNSLNYYLASYFIPYVGLTGYVGAFPMLEGSGAKGLVAGLLGVEAGQDAVIRTWLYERKDKKVEPYSFTVAEITDKISMLRNKLDHGTIDDEGLTVPKQLGSDMMTTGNILSCDVNSLAYPRTPKQIFDVVYSTGDASKPGGFYPNGGNGTYAKSFLGQSYP